ncbi:hypothetical protein DYB37_002794 [Aphanomyces astaci]|uniref:Anoctamin transmembrane domain-containing protein n=1 Tax=Aphanomyces astaci TaxID=112090 RepID=A0A3R6Y737_APHAT|nr:hypothetical protein DYB37_002794 [Aphanomyces astaci]
MESHTEHASSSPQECGSRRSMLQVDDPLTNTPNYSTNHHNDGSSTHVNTRVHIDPLDACVHDILDEAATSPPNPPHPSEVMLHELAIDMPDDILHASLPAPPMPAPPLFHQSSSASSNKLRLSTDGEVDVDAAILHSSSISSTSLLPLPPPLALTFHFAILVKVPRLPAADDGNSIAPVVTFDPMVLQGLEDLAKRLALAGFLVRLESRPAYKKHAPHLKLVFLLHAPDAILSDMQAKMEVERWVAGGRNGEHFLAPQQHGKLTSADRIVLVDRLLHAPRRHGGLGLLELQSSCPFKAFPLHDDRFNREYLTHWFLQWRAYFRNNTDSVEKIRVHFGEKAALYFAYMDFYTKWLLPLALWGLFIYFLSAFSPTLYFRMSAITGLAVSTLWATLFLIFWKRRRSELRLKWGVGAQEHAHVINPHFQPPPPTASLNGVKWSRRLKYIVGYLVLVVFLVGETVITIGFVDLYFFLKAGCGGNCSTGGLENWVLVLCQGILLGLVVDIIQYQIFRVIAVSLTQWENHPTEKRYESSRALKVFLWDFFGIYSWFWMCAFVYVPYGSQFSSLLNEYNLLPWTSSYEPGLLELQSMFVTPLVATQGLKIVFEKIIPYFLLQAAKKASDAKGMYDVYHSTLAENFDRDGKTASVAATASPPSPPTGATLPPLLRAKSSTRIISDMLTSLPKLSRKLTTPHDTFADYADTLVQFGYVSQFTCVWPFIPVCAVINNVFEVRSSAFQRVVPQRTSSMGSWNLFLRFNNIWAIFINVALICYASGLLESFFPTCVQLQVSTDYAQHLPAMVPNFSCIASSDRFAIFVHVLVLVYVTLTLSINAVPSSIKRILKTKDRVLKEHFAAHVTTHDDDNDQRRRDLSHDHDDQAAKHAILHDQLAALLADRRQCVAPSPRHAPPVASGRRPGVKSPIKKFKVDP